jgi:hypothetical protein
MKNKSIASELRDVAMDVTTVPTSLEGVFRMQEEFERMCAGGGTLIDKCNDESLLGSESGRYMVGARRATATRDFIDAMHNELEELREHTPWKPWKAYPKDMNEALGRNMSPECDELKYELIDLLHFLVVLFEVWGMKPRDVYRMYAEKMAVNIRRQKNGY